MAEETTGTLLALLPSRLRDGVEGYTMAKMRVDSCQFTDLRSMLSGLRELEEVVRQENKSRTAPPIYVQDSRGNQLGEMFLECHRLTDGSPVFYITLDSGEDN